MSPNYNYCSAYKSSAAEALLAERGRIDSSHQMIDATLECALVHLLLFSSCLLTNSSVRFFPCSLLFMCFQTSPRDPGGVRTPTFLAWLHSDAYGWGTQ